jgi:hypothetical protein
MLIALSEQLLMDQWDTFEEDAETYVFHSGSI